MTTIKASDAGSLIGSFTPPGVVHPYAGATAPAGWLLCEGAAISRSAYPSLFAAIGVAWGYGDNSTTFNLPDMRGRFPRGRANGSANDPDRASRTASNTGGNTGDNIGSVQGHELYSHSHSAYYGRSNTAQDPPSGANQGMIPVNINWGPYSVVYGYGGNETRPVNANFNYIIKY